jgi:hypothetical protein
MTMITADFLTCFHEAGHVIAANALGLQFHYVTVERYEDGPTEYGGHIARPLRGHNTLVAKAVVKAFRAGSRKLKGVGKVWQKDIKMLMAGDIAVRIYHDQHVPCVMPRLQTFDWSQRPDTDPERVAELFGLYGDTDQTFTYERAEAETKALLIDRWQEVVSLAVALRKQTKLTQIEVMRLLRIPRTGMMERFAYQG